MPRAETERLIEAGARALHVDDYGFLTRWTARDASLAVLAAVLPLINEWAEEVRRGAEG